MRFPASRLLVFARDPVPGRVKTRLEPLLGARGAAALHARFVHERLALASRANLCPLELWCTPSPESAFFRDCGTRYGATLHEQSPGGLGRRMQRALTDVLARARNAVLIGTDCPGLTTADLAEALASLEQGTDVVLGPASDGGYYLIGLRRPLPGLFSGIQWGGARVFAETLARLERRGIAYHSLPMRDDVDTPDDVRRLRISGSG